jgi:membrane protein DedA with SNARE-associated domain
MPNSSSPLLRRRPRRNASPPEYSSSKPRKKDVASNRHRRLMPSLSARRRVRGDHPRHFHSRDAATVASGCSLPKASSIPVPALVALVVGTAAGDLAIHGIGRVAQHSWIGRRLLANQKVQRVEAWLQGNAVLALAGARFVPGLRLPVYLMSGIVRVPFTTCAAVVISVSMVWTPGLFILGQTTEPLRSWSSALMAGRSALLCSGLPLPVPTWSGP